MLPFSNPRLLAEFDNWPCGGQKVNCRFEIQDDGKKGFRVLRFTTDRNGKWCKPKTSTYEGPAAIVDGADGRTYVIQSIRSYAAVKVMASDFMDANLPGQPSSYVFMDAGKLAQLELYNTLQALITAAK